MKLALLETEVIDFFVHLARVLGLPKSAAEIYGLLFIAGRPLAMEEVIDTLHLSKGAVSQGLKLLRALGAVRSVYMAGKRNDHYEAEVELRRLVNGLIKDQLEPRLESGSARLDRIETLLSGLTQEERARFHGRFDKLKSWRESGRRLLPVVQEFLK